MISLDMRTLVFGNVVTDIVCTLVILLLWRQSRKRFAGIGFWVLDFAFQTVAMFLIISRGSIPDWMSMVLSNTLVIGGAILGYEALGRFVGKRISQVHNYVLLAAFVCVHSYFEFVQPNQAARNLNVSAGLLIICFQCAWLLEYGIAPNMRRLTRGVGMVFGAYCLVSVVRIIASLTGQHADDYFRSGAFESLVLISYQLLFILLTYGLALMVSKRLLGEVRTEEEKFAKAFRSSPYAIMLTRLSDGRISDVNEGFLNITGYRYEEAVGRTTIDLHLWDKEEDREVAVEELSKSGKAQGSEFRFRKKSGEKITGLFSAEIIPIDNEPFVLSSISDITERKQAEEALRESEQRWATTLASIGDAVIATDAESRISFLNPVAAALTGWPMEEAVGRPVLELFRIVNEKTRQPGEDIVGRVLREGGKVALANHTALVARGGREIPIEDSAAPIRDSAGKVVGVVIVFHDVTEKRLAVEALRESEDRLRFALETSHTGAWDLDLVEHTSNRSLEHDRIFGYEELLPQWTYEMFLGHVLQEDRAAVDEKFRTSTAAFRDWNFECRIRRTDGQVRWILSAGRHREDANGSPRRMAGVVQDITERKQAEVALQTAHAQLQDHARRLEETNRELEGFAYTISHDLRAPLRAINGFAHMLGDDYGPSLDAEGKRRLAVIEANAVKMGLLIDDLLAFSRAGRTTMNVSPIDMNSLVADVLETQKTSQSGAKADIQVTGLPPARGDAALIRQVLANLLENAVKFSRKRQDPKIEVGSLEREGERVYFVKDNGVGFDMKYHDKLFGVFQRLVTEKEFEGTGVGLAIVHRLVTRHGGRVWAEAKPGEGATFFFTLGR